MTLSTKKPTQEERATMTHAELLRTVWLLDEVLDSFRWIPVSERLPEEPPEGMFELDKLEEYIVTIEGAKKATSLAYAGDGEWYRDGVFYKVSAWMPMPENYKF